MAERKKEKKGYQEIRKALESIRYKLGPETGIQDQIDEVLKRNGIEFRREYELSPKDRIDFICGTIGIEAKINRAGARLLSQCARYLESDELEMLIVVSVRPADLPEILRGKPIENVAIWNKLAAL